MKNRIKEWLKKLEDANKKEFGTQSLDCCTVGREKQDIKKVVQLKNQTKTDNKME